MRKNQISEASIRKQVTSGNPVIELERIHGTALRGEVDATQEGERLSRRMLISHYHFVDGLPVTKIARETGLSYYIVRKTLQDIKAECRDEGYLQWTADFIEQAFWEIEIQKAHYYVAWERTQEIADREQIVRKYRVNEIDADGNKIVTEIARSTTQHEYNTKPLEGMLKCIELQAKLLGVFDNPSRFADSTAEPAEESKDVIDLMTPEQQAQAFADFLTAMVRRHSSPPDNPGVSDPAPVSVQPADFGTPPAKPTPEPVPEPRRHSLDYIEIEPGVFVRAATAPPYLQRHRGQ